MVDNFFKTMKQFLSDPEKPQHLPEPADPDRDQNFYRDFHDSLMSLSEKLYVKEDDKTIIMETLKATCEFYQADWCGIIIADMETTVWEPVCWHNTRLGEMAETHFGEVNIFDDFISWLPNLESLEAMVIPDCDAMKDVYPKEYERYRRLHAKSLMGIPFGSRPTGYMILRNLVRYKDRPDLARITAYIAMSTYFRNELIEDRNNVWDAALKKGAEAGVRINLLGSPEVRNALESVDAAMWNSDIGWKAIVYLALHRGTVSARRLSQVIWPYEDPEKCIEKRLHMLIHRIRDRFKMIDENFIVTTNPAYTINWELPVTCDVYILEDLIEKARKEPDEHKRMRLLLDIQSLYRGPVYQEQPRDLWLSDCDSHYEKIYREATKLLLEELKERKDYACMRDYSYGYLTKADGDAEIYYRLIYASMKLSMKDAAHRDYKIAGEKLSEEELERLTLYLNNRFPSEKFNSSTGIS